MDKSEFAVNGLTRARGTGSIDAKLGASCGGIDRTVARGVEAVEARLKEARSCLAVSERAAILTLNRCARTALVPAGCVTWQPGPPG